MIDLRKLASERLAASALLAGLVSLGSCSADEAPAPEPTLTTPGAFIAVPVSAAEPGGEGGAAGQATTPDAASDGYQLIRVLLVLDATAQDQFVFHFSYERHSTLEAARQATARRRGVPSSFVVTSLEALETSGAVVVGFRSLTEAEQDVIR